MLTHELLEKNRVHRRSGESCWIQMVRSAITTAVVTTIRMTVAGVIAVLAVAIAIVIAIANATAVVVVVIGLIRGGHLNNLSSMILHHLVSRGVRRII